MSTALQNLLIESLSPADRANLLRGLEFVELPRRAALFEAEEQPRYVHFVTSGVASIVTQMESGESVEVSIVGCESFPEKLFLFGPQVGPLKCFMQISGAAWRMPFKRFQSDFLPIPGVARAMQQSMQYEALALSQLVACNRLHNVEERLARWLLMVQDRVGESELRLTQEFLGEMLGARRSSVNLAAGSLQRAGVISYRRGRIQIQHRDILESVACECYGVIARFFRELYRS